MIELFEIEPQFGDIEGLIARAERPRKHDQGAALRAAVLALHDTHAREATYRRAVRVAARLFEQHGEPRAALSLAWYARDTDHEERLYARVPSVDRARTLARWAEANDREHYRKAAAELQDDEHLVRAAIYYERGGDMGSARAFWSRLGGLLDKVEGQSYAAGLTHFNLARTSLETGDERAARDASVAAVHRLEEAADHFESIGQRERSFDCYQVLIALGELSGVFEHVLEGVVNAVRILSEDNLRVHALSLYEHGISLAERAGENAAAATLAREMADYALKQGMPRLVEQGTLRQAELWERVADTTIEQGGPSGLVENALLASLLAKAELGQYASVGSVYKRLEGLNGIEPARRRHYARAAQRYAHLEDRSLAGSPDAPLGRQVAPARLWHVDLIEWEEQGSASEACADLLLEPDDPDDRITARTALLGRLVGLAADAEPSDRAKVLCVEYLGKIGLYPLLAPLESFYSRGSRAVRLAAVKALSRYLYKRTFVTLERALDDDDPRVADRATRALEDLHFEHGFDPLARIYRTARREEARLAALKALARIDIPEAAELVLGTLEHGGQKERSAAVQVLKSARGSRFIDAAQTVYAGASPEVRAAISEILSARGVEV